MSIVNTPKVLIVTPARNEAHYLPLLLNSLKIQTYNVIALFVLVDDDSNDETQEIMNQWKSNFPIITIKSKSSGRIITGGAYFSWWAGVNHALELKNDFNYVMKLDADVSLSPDYFEKLKDGFDNKVDVLGGVIYGKSREQKSYVPGPVKMYSIRALNEIKALPIATGFDVMDEVLCKKKGLRAAVYSDAKFKMNREIGFSQGKLHGRYRNGLVCRWTGYAPEYFMLHLIRYIFRRPFITGAIWMLVGFLKADSGPYSTELRIEHRKIQRARLLRFYKNPIATFREIYF